jgi:threonine synthase
VSALAKGFDDCLAIGLIQKKPRIIVAQTQAAAPFYQAFQRGFNQLEPLQAQKTLASAIQIGNPVSYPKAVRAIQDYNGLVVAVSEEELSNAAHRADRFGFYTCPHTGVALAALEKLVESGDIDKEEEVAIISTAHGLKFTEFKVAYHEKSLKEIHSSFANSVFYTPPQIDSVMDILQKEMKARQH